MLQSGEPWPGGPRCTGNMLGKTAAESLERGKKEATQPSVQSEARRAYMAKPHPPPPTCLPKISQAAQSFGEAASLQPASFLLPAVTSEVPRMCQTAGAEPTCPSDFRFLRDQPPTQCQSPVPSSPLSLFWATIHEKPVQLGNGPTLPEPLFTSPSLRKPTQWV